MFINNILSLAYGQITENIKSKYDISSVKLLIYNSYIVIPACICLIFFSGEYNKLQEFSNYSLGFFFYLISSCILTAILNASYFISNEANSSLFTQLCSNCKDILITSIGFLMIKDFDFTLNILLGTIISSLGGIIFSLKTLVESVKKKEN